MLEGETLEVATTLREGCNELLLFLHGLGCSRESFLYFWPRPEYKGYSALSMDFIGFGESTSSGTFSYTMEDQARVCVELLKYHLGKKIHIISHSMGCAVALLLPDEILKSIETFVSIEGNLIGADCGVVSRRVIALNMQDFAKDQFPKLQVQLAGIGKGRFALETNSAEALYKSSQSLVTWSDSEKLLDKFRSLTCRKIYFYGDENNSHPTIERIVDVEKVGVKNSGHFPMVDNPQDFYEALHRFLIAENAI